MLLSKKLTQKLDFAIYAGIRTLPDHDPRKRICYGVNVMAVLVIALDSIIGGITYYFTKNGLILAGISVAIFFICGSILLNYRNRYRSASLVFYSTILLSVFYFCCVLGKSAESQLMVLYLIGLSIFAFDDIPTQAICIGASIIVIIGLEINFSYDLIKPMDASPAVRGFVRWAVYFVAIALVATTFVLYKKSNITLLKETQEHTAIIEANLEKEEQENQKKDKLISNATHEMRVSFYSIFAILDMLYKLDRSTNNENLKGTIDDLRAACKLSKSIIDNILEYEKYEARLSNTILNQLIDIRVVIFNLIDIYKYLADERDVRIIPMVSPDLPQHILADEVKIRQIITNMLHNAIKFTRQHTTITIRVGMEYGNLSLQVRDQGEGVRPDELDLIFEPFVTRNPDGLGLGLFVVKELVASMGGDIMVANELHGGASFTVSLPMDSAVEAEIQEYA